MIVRSKLPRYGWYLYDFGCSILIINGGLYFPQWIVDLNGVGDLTYNLTFVLSSILLIIVAPLVGLAADYRKSSFRYLVGSSALLAVAGLGVGIAPFIQARDARVMVALVAFFFVLVAYQLSLVFYNTLLGLVSDEDDYESVSGRALAWGWAGGITGILIGFPFARGLTPQGGIGAILPAAIIACVIVTISLYLISRASQDHVTVVPSVTTTKPSIVLDEILGVLRNRAVLAFLLAYFLFGDAILTIQNNSTIYMQAVLGLTDAQKAYEFLLILVTSAFGAMASVRVVHAFGLRRGLMLVLAFCMITVIVTPAFTRLTGFSLIFGLLGLLNGAVWNISRVLFFRLIPISRRSTYFGLYSTFERFASVIGPIVWSICVTLVPGQTLRYQVAWVTMSLFFLMSIVLLAQFKMPNESDATRSA